MPKSGRFNQIVRPRERIVLRAISAEARLKRQGIEKYNKRFRSWAQHRVRKYQIALPTVLTTDTALMDCKYITACIQKAAKLRKHDAELWEKYLHGFLFLTQSLRYSERIVELGPEFDAVDWGYVLWGFGKSGFLNASFYEKIAPHVRKEIPNMTSHALMALLWCFKRAHYRDKETCQLAVRTALLKVDEVRPLDYIKICNAAASLDVLPEIKPGTYLERSQSSWAMFKHNYLPSAFSSGSSSSSSSRIPLPPGNSSGLSIASGSSSSGSSDSLEQMNENNELEEVSNQAPKSAFADVDLITGNSKKNNLGVNKSIPGDCFNYNLLNNPNVSHNVQSSGLNQGILNKDLANTNAAYKHTLQSHNATTPKMMRDMHWDLMFPDHHLPNPRTGKITPTNPNSFYTMVKNQSEKPNSSEMDNVYELYRRSQSSVPTDTDYAKNYTTSSESLLVDVENSSLKKRISEVTIEKLEKCFAQEFRDAVNPVAMVTLYKKNPEVIKYLLTRFRRIMITARPHHLMKAYECAVICRVMFPQVWADLDYEIKQFYVRLSQRHIPALHRGPNGFHWNVSKHLAHLKLDHRNSFRFGPYHIDIGLEQLQAEDKRDCIVLDNQTAFYFGTNQYTKIRKIQHEMLSQLGWNVYHVRYDDWFKFGPGEGDSKKQFLLDLLNSEPTAVLKDRDPITKDEVLNNVRRKKNYLMQVRELRKDKKIEVQF